MQIGLAPLCLVAAASEESASFDANAQPAIFELPGSLHELYKSGDLQ